MKWMVALAMALVAGHPVKAQVNTEDPMKKILELFQKAGADLDSIDELLLGADTSRGKQAKDPRKEIRKAEKKQAEVIRIIDEILKNLPSSQCNSGSSGSMSKPKSSPGKKESQKNKRSRRKREKRPDLVKKDKASKKPKNGTPKSRKKSPPRKSRKRFSRKPPENPTGGTPPKSGNKYWGTLPLFLRDIFRGEDAPRLPPKYIPFWKAFLRGRKKKQ